MVLRNRMYATMHFHNTKLISIFRFLSIRFCGGQDVIGHQYWTVLEQTDEIRYFFHFLKYNQKSNNLMQQQKCYNKDAKKNESKIQLFLIFIQFYSVRNDCRVKSRNWILKCHTDTGFN